MANLIQEARDFATKAHKRIDQRRMYTHQPYEVHLKKVASYVAEVGGDDEMVAAAWLHDTVEDTPATHGDIEAAFGHDISQLVYELTDISKPSDGNRAQRKAIDRAHIASASPRAKSIKLADLIDNLHDICQHDDRFGKTFLAESAALIEVLHDGNGELLRRARKTMQRCSEKLKVDAPPGSLLLEEEQPLRADSSTTRRAVRLFTEEFTARDVAEPLRTFDGDSPCEKVLATMVQHNLDVVGVRHEGVVIGYALRSDLNDGTLGERARSFGTDQLLSGDASLSDLILILTRHDHAFIRMLDSVVGSASRIDIEKPIVRMWLFGMITLLEMNAVNWIKQQWPDGDVGWRGHVSKGRLKKAEQLYDERQRRYQHSTLLDCLQFSDKLRVVLYEMGHEAIELPSRRAAEQIIGDIESLRNNLAHGQPFVHYDWPQIARMTQRVEEYVIGF